MYATMVWAMGQPPFMLQKLERSFVTILSWKIRSESVIPYQIIKVEFTSPPMLVDALVQVVVFMIGDLVKILGHPDYFMSLKDIRSWYNVMVSWLFANDIEINNLSPLRYDLEIDKTLISHWDNNKIICQEIWKIYI